MSAVVTSSRMGTDCRLNKVQHLHGFLASAPLVWVVGVHKDSISCQTPTTRKNQQRKEDFLDVDKILEKFGQSIGNLRSRIERLRDAGGEVTNLCVVHCLAFSSQLIFILFSSRRGPDSATQTH